MFRSKLVVAILLILATVLVGCSGSTTVIASPTVEVLPTEKPTATQIPPTATPALASVVWLDEDPMELEEALEFASQDCREIPELEAYADAAGVWFPADPDKVDQYSMELFGTELFEQIESRLSVSASYMFTVLWHYVPNTEFCWAFSISFDEIEEQLLAYETEAGEIVVLSILPIKLNEKPVVWLDEDPIGLRAALELVSQNCREIPELEAFLDDETWFPVDPNKLNQYDKELFLQVVPGLPLATSYTIERHYVPGTSFCWTFSISPDEIEEQFLAYETEAGEIVVLPIWTWYFRMEETVAQDCQELYDFEGNVIDEKPLGIGDLLMRSGFMKAGGREPDWESWYIRTDVGECLAVEVTDDTGTRFVVYKAKDGEVKTLKIEE